jgi:hypothetical protein
MRLNSLHPHELVSLSAEAVVTFAADLWSVDRDLVIRVRALWQAEPRWCEEMLGRTPGGTGRYVGLADLTGDELLLLDTAAQAAFY